MRDESDVLVIGGGIAGIIAAIEAARHGASVAIACTGQLFGGSSFYPGTWGLGLIGPESQADEEDLIATIEEVGCGVAEHELVEVFVRGIRPAISWLENELGVPLKRPSSEQSARDKTFIPCFDHKQRLWRGITREAFVTSARHQMQELGIRALERVELMRIIQSKEHGHAACGAVLFDGTTESFRSFHASSVILAAGGTGGLFDRSLTSRDVLSSAHTIAMDAGCELVNIEFMQMMPGLIAPVRGIVFNEKTFRYAILEDANGILPRDEDELANLLETRSSHGPCTCRLDDERVDLAIDAAGNDGLPVRYRFPDGDVPEFIQTFTTWMQEDLGISPEEELRLAMYAHAANGGIRIDKHAWTGVEGLYACGEVTGGMHGADRIGGLSSANGLVFGRIAGKEAARHAGALQQADTSIAAVSYGHDGNAAISKLGCVVRENTCRRTCREIPEQALIELRSKGAPLGDADATRMTQDMRCIMSASAMINRTEKGLTEALEDIERLQHEIDYHRKCRGCVTPSDRSLARGVRAESQLALSHAMLQAMRKRRMSLGSHLRVDAM